MNPQWVAKLVGQLQEVQLEKAFAIGGKEEATFLEMPLLVERVCNSLWTPPPESGRARRSVYRKRG